PPWLHRRRHPSARGAPPHDACVDARGAPRAVRMGRRGTDRDRPGASRMTGMPSMRPLDRLDDERVGRPEAPVTTIKRRFSGRFPIDPFGLDPQLADLVTPAFSVALPVRV